MSSDDGLFAATALADSPSPRRPRAPKRTAAEMHDLLRRRYAAISPGNGPRYVLAPEVRNQAGFGGYWSGRKLRSADLIVLDSWESGPVRLIGHEIKVSRSDWLHELADPEKAQAFIPHVAEWWLVVADGAFVRDGELPEGWGLLAPAGDTLRAVVKAARKPQEPIPVGMMASLLRRVQSVEQSRAEKRAPFTSRDVPRSSAREGLPPNGKPSEIQHRRWSR